MDKNIFINRADSGCISSREGTVYSVGEEVIALDWRLLSLTVVTKLPHSAQAEGCTAISLDSDNFGFFFLSGDFYSITNSRWTEFKKPEPAFNIFSINNQPVILGFASIESNCEEEEEGCLAVRRTLYGDNRVVQHNLETDTWDQIGYLGGHLNNSIQTQRPSAFILLVSLLENVLCHQKLASFNFLFVFQSTPGLVTASPWKSQLISATVSSGHWSQSPARMIVIN